MVYLEPTIYEYKQINVSLEPTIESTLHGDSRIRKPTIETAANRWAAMGWRTVAVMPGDHKAGYADSILVERVKPYDRT